MSNITTKIILEKFTTYNLRGDEYSAGSMECSDLDQCIKLGNEYLIEEPRGRFNVIESTQGDSIIDIFDDETGDKIIYSSK